MPTYAYACKDCDHAFDIHQSFSDDSLSECPECRGALRKKFNSVGVVFKGSGFYRTDSRSGTGSSVPASAGTGTSGKGAAGGDAGKQSTAAATSGKSATAGASPAGTSSASTSKATASVGS